MHEDNNDPLTMYLIINHSLGMSVGKLCAQVAHGAQLITMQYYDLKEELSKIQKLVFSDRKQPDNLIKLKYTEMCNKINIMSNWMNADFRKVSLKADIKT